MLALPTKPKKKITQEGEKMHSRLLKSPCTGAEVNHRVKMKHSEEEATKGCGASAVLHVPAKLGLPTT